jgi:uncharacterized membrane protein YhaH (DUF805 family)
MDWYLGVLKKYAQFSGRARRKEYWMYFLFNVVIAFVLGLVDGLLGLTGASGIGLLGGLYTLAVLVPSLAVAVRRLHDTGRSGWWLLVALVPLVGGIVLLVLLVLPGQSGPNAHGEDPKGGMA